VSAADFNHVMSFIGGAVNTPTPAISSHLSDLINQYISLRAQRIVKEKEAAEIQELEEDLKKTIISKFREGDIKAMGSTNGLVKMMKTEEPVANDWLAVWEYIRENDAFELLHRRLTNTAVKERWDAGIEIPGVGRTDVYKLTVSKAT
jgi:hypothetical protein